MVERKTSVKKKPAKTTKSKVATRQSGELVLESLDRLMSAGLERMSLGMARDLLFVLVTLKRAEGQWVPFMDLFEPVQYTRRDLLLKRNRKNKLWNHRTLSRPTQGHFKEAKLSAKGRKLLASIGID